MASDDAGLQHAVAVRRGNARDHAFVLDLGRRAAASSISSLRPAGVESVEIAFERLMYFVFGREHDILIAHEGTEPLGFLLLLRDVPDEVTNAEQAFVAYMAVEPAAQRRGIGRALLAGAEAIARAVGLPHIVLMVTEDNTAARALYASMGFGTERRMLAKPL
jgi:ribosomal protein S18 acetylase RimI-like enzyme